MNRSKKSELRTAAEYGGVRNPGSGNRREAGRRKDVRRHGVFRIEQKDPFSFFYNLKVVELDGLWDVATAASEVPVFLIRAPDGVSDVVILDLEDYRQYVDGEKVGSAVVRKQKRINLESASRLGGYIELETPKRSYALTPIGAFDTLLERIT